MYLKSFRNLISKNYCFYIVRRVFDSDDRRLIEFLKLFLCTLNDTVFFQKPVFFFEKNKVTFMKKGNIITNFLQITYNMGRN